MVEYEETLNAIDEKIDRVLNTSLRSADFFQTGGTKSVATRAWRVCANFGPYSEREEKIWLERFGVLKLHTVGDLMHVPRIWMTRLPNLGLMSIELMENAFNHLMMKELGVSLPLFKSEHEGYKDPLKAIKEFIATKESVANQNIGAKLSMNFNAQTFVSGADDTGRWSMETNVADKRIGIFINREVGTGDLAHEFRLHVNGKHLTSGRGYHMPISQSENGVASVQVDDVIVTVNRTGDDFRLNIVQKLG